tara:strand:- start:324 stop:908 length:585 start_codon:yes stop_codon:yes gene_type:complete
MISIHYAIEAIQEYCEHFSNKVPNAAKDRWVKRLRELNPSKHVLDAAVRRCADNDLGPAWSRLRASISVEMSIEKAKSWDSTTGDSRAFEQFRAAYEKEGLSSGHHKPPKSNQDEETTDPRIAASCYRVIGRILRGTNRCPPEIAEHDIHAAGDAETAWFWSEVKKDIFNASGKEHGNDRRPGQAASSDTEISQ